jgi:hypothetical protein
MEILLREGLARLETSFRAEKKALPGTLVLGDSSLLENVANHTCICATAVISALAASAKEALRFTKK